MLNILGFLIPATVLSSLLYIDYFLISHRINGEINNRGFAAFSRVMQFGYANRLLVFIFQISIALQIDLGNSAAPLLVFLIFVPSIVILIAMTVIEISASAPKDNKRIISKRDLFLLYVAYLFFSSSWIMPLVINLFNDDLKSTAMTSVTLANGVAGFIIAFVQEPILQKLVSNPTDLKEFLREIRTIRRNISIGLIVISIVVLMVILQ